MRTTRIVSALAALTLLAPLPAADAAAQGDDVRRVRLERDTVVSGIHCAPTGRQYAEFYADGRLAECPLAAPTRVGAHEFGAGTWLIFHPDGRLRLAWLERDTRLGRVLCKGTGYREWVTTFHDDGSLATCYLPRTATIDGVACRAGSFWGEITGGVTVRFHPNGRLESCALAHATTIDGQRYRAWRRAHFDADGRLVHDDD